MFYAKKQDRLPKEHIMKHKVVFCFHTNDHEYNLGIGFLSAFLKKNGIDVSLVIFREIEGKQKDNLEDVVLRILEEEPTVVAFSVMTFNWHHIRHVIRLLRPKFNGFIIVGGYHAILSPSEVISEAGVDAVCIGEGERPLLTLLEQYDAPGKRAFASINGLVFANEKNSAEPFRKKWLAARMEDYPYMDYELFDCEGKSGLQQKQIGMLSYAGVFSLPVITGRGCPYKCTYCSNSVLIETYGGLQNFLRKYSVESAIENIKTLVNRYKPQFIEFMDETFTLSRTWVKEFCSLYKEEIGLPYTIMSRVDTLDEETIDRMAESGLKLAFFGIECGDEEYRMKYLNRKMSNKTIKDGAAILKKHGIMIVTFNMFGMPFETKTTTMKTIELNEEIAPDTAIPFIYQPFPGTELSKIAYENNMALPPPQDRWDYCTTSLDTPELPAAYVTEMVKQFREKFTSQKVVDNFYNKIRNLARPAVSSL